MSCSWIVFLNLSMSMLRWYFFSGLRSWKMSCISWIAASFTTLYLCSLYLLGGMMAYPFARRSTSHPLYFVIRLSSLGVVKYRWYPPLGVLVVNVFVFWKNVWYICGSSMSMQMRFLLFVPSITA
jgi:hypothetical protein